MSREPFFSMGAEDENREPGVFGSEPKGKFWEPREPKGAKYFWKKKKVPKGGFQPATKLYKKRKETYHFTS